MSDFPKLYPFNFSHIFFFNVGNGKILIIQGLRAAQYDLNKVL